MDGGKGAREPVVTPGSWGKSAVQAWPMPIDPVFLQGFLTYVFETYWDQIIYGPLIDGAAYELTCPNAPTKIDLHDGYLTVAFGGPHFHLCIDDCYGNPAKPAPEAYRARRKPSKAQIVRQLDGDGAPMSWFFEMRNGADEPMITIFFASPFVGGGDVIEPVPRWERLAMWRDISARYLGRPPEVFDETGKGFAGMTV